jgi:mRNA-degrading endonuclease RelE of RelBE toxin-antitoxin system
MYQVRVSSTFQKEYHSLDPESQTHIKTALERLAKDPSTPRTHTDIKLLKDTDPEK